MAVPQPEPRISRFEKYAFGMFIHYGLYSQLGQGEWTLRKHELPWQEYSKLKDTFTAEDFDGRQIARLARKAGMKYVCLTTRHHDGFSLFDTCGLSDFDAVHSPAGRDLILDFADGCRAEGVVPFFYHTMFDWSQPSCENDFDTYLKYLRDSVEVLCTNYGEVGGLWFDGLWSKPGCDWQEDELYAVIRKHQPEAIIVNNVGIEAGGSLGHPEVDSVNYERCKPHLLNREGMTKYLAAEMCDTLCSHWGYARNDFNYKSPAEIISNLAACRRVGANYLLNIGPEAQGRIPAYQQGVLELVGQWIALAGDVVYEGTPVEVSSDETDFALEMDGKLYLFIHDIGIKADAAVLLGRQGAGRYRSFQGVRQTVKSARWMDNHDEVEFTQSGSDTLTLDVGAYPYGTDTVVRVCEVIAE